MRRAGIVFLNVLYSKVTVYIRKNITVHKCAGIIRMRLLFKKGLRRGKIW